jgi:hypothetical protein
MTRIILAALLAVAIIPAARAQTAGCPVGIQCVALQNFVPAALTATLAVTTVSASTVLPATGPTYGVLVTNQGAATAFVAIGVSGVVATTFSTPVAPGFSVWLPQGTSTTIAAVTAAGTATLSLQTGTGAPSILNGYVNLAPGTQLVGVVGASPISFQQLTTTSAAPLPANTLGIGIVVKALATNVAKVCIGGSTVTLTTGYCLYAGEAISYSVANSNLIYIVGANGTDAIQATGN